MDAAVQTVTYRQPELLLLLLQMPAAAPAFTPLLHLPDLWRSLPPVNVGYIMKRLLALVLGGGFDFSGERRRGTGLLSVQLSPHSHEGLDLFLLPLYSGS